MKSKPKSTGRLAPETIQHLSLNLHREFFAAILAGEKKTEYRSNTSYWRKRLVGRRYQEIHFRNGYAARAPFMRVECLGIRRPNRSSGVFSIRLGKVIDSRYCAGKFGK